MQFLTTTIGVLLGLAVLGAMGLGAYWGIAWLIGLFTSLDPEIAAVTGVLSVIALLAAMIVAGGSGRAARQAMAGQVQAEKATTYSLLLDLWERLIRDGSPAAGSTADAVAEALRSLDLRLALYGSATVLKTHGRLRGLLADGKLNAEDARSALVATVLEIRRELGSGTTGLPRVDLHRTLFPSTDGQEASSVSGTDAPPAASPPSDMAQRP